MRSFKPGIGICLLVTLALAGCAGPAATEPAGSSGPGDPPAGDPDVPAAPAWSPILVADAAQGTAPFNVTFRIDTNRSLDAVSWTLDLGDGNTTSGTGTPATHAHAFGVGAFTAVLQLTHAGDTKTASVVIKAVAPAARVLPGPIIEAYDAKVMVSAPWLLWDETGEAPALDMDAVAWLSYEHDLPNQDGHAFKVAPGMLWLRITSAALAGEVHDPSGELCGPDDSLEYDTDMFLYEADGTLVAQSGGCGTGEDILVPVPAAGDYVVVQLGYTGANMVIPTTITSQPDHV